MMVMGRYRVFILAVVLLLSLMASKILGLLFAERFVKWWTEELTMEMRGVVLNCRAVSWSLGRRRRASRKVETTFVVMVDLGDDHWCLLSFICRALNTHSLSSNSTNSCVDMPAFSIIASSLSNPSALCANALTEA